MSAAGIPRRSGSLSNRVIGRLGAVAFSIILFARPCAADGAAPPGSPVDGPLTIERLVAAFEVVAFGSEARTIRRHEGLLKWAVATVPVSMTRYAEDRHGRPVPVPVPVPLAALARRHLTALSRVTGLTFPDAAAADGRGITVLFTGRSQLAHVPIPGVGPALQREMAAPGGCYFIVKADPDGRLQRTFVVVNTDRDGPAIDHCILEELTQSLGLPNDSDILRPSIFSDHDRLRALGEGDRLLLKALYHAALTPGMDRVTALGKARLIFAEELARR